jgi:hypothetical protein
MRRPNTSDYNTSVVYFDRPMQNALDEMERTQVIEDERSKMGKTVIFSHLITNRDSATSQTTPTRTHMMTKSFQVTGTATRPRTASKKSHTTRSPGEKWSKSKKNGIR